MLVCGTYERLDRLIDRSIHPVSFNSPRVISACLQAYKDRPRAQPFVCHMALPAATLSIHPSIHPSTCPSICLRTLGLHRTEAYIPFVTPSS